MITGNLSLHQATFYNFFFLEIAESLLDYKITPWENYAGEFQDILVVISSTKKNTFLAQVILNHVC